MRWLPRIRKSEPEVNSGVPVAGMPGTVKPLTIQELMARHMRDVSREAEAAGYGSLEDEDDFEEDDPDVMDLTGYQVEAMDDVELRQVAGALGVDLSDETPAPASPPVRNVRGEAPKEDPQASEKV